MKSSSTIPIKAIEQSETEDGWLNDLKHVVTDPKILLTHLDIPITPEIERGFRAKKLFNLRVPLPFITRMEKGNIEDPLLKQVLTDELEFEEVIGFIQDPLEEQVAILPGLLHKYKSRVLIILKGGCAINCRYCFRRHFPYQNNAGTKQNLKKIIEYIKITPTINEVILSGGDPLMAKDEELAWLFEQLESIVHISTIRIHTRLAVVIPNRITTGLLHVFSSSVKKIVLVTHINHANEIDDTVIVAMAKLKHSGVTLLNQSVLLKYVNDSADVLIELSYKLFQAGVLPYYLHVLDKVEGASHFYITDESAKKLMVQIITELPGYLVPKLTREVAGEKSKTTLFY